MVIQSLSIVVPNRSCINNCKFCVSRMRNDEYENRLLKNNPKYLLAVNDYYNRLEFARDNGCNTIIFTGTSEPQQNKEFLKFFADLNNKLKSPFKRIEMQTTGVILDEDYLTFLREEVGVNTISLSLASFDDFMNKEITQMKKAVNIKKLCNNIKKLGFNLRLSVNLSKIFNDFTPKTLMEQCKLLGADQLTLRVLFQSEDKTLPQNIWIRENMIRDDFIDGFKEYIKKNGRPLELLDFGQMRYSLEQISTVIDDDCMSQEVKQVLKYLILRENCKLYTKWDDKGSLLF